MEVMDSALQLEKAIVLLAAIYVDDILIAAPVLEILTTVKGANGIIPNE